MMILMEMWTSMTYRKLSVMVRARNLLGPFLHSWNLATTVTGGCARPVRSVLLCPTDSVNLQVLKWIDERLKMLRENNKG